MAEIKQYEVLKWASLFLKTHGCEEPIAEILLRHHLNVSRSSLYMTMRDPVPQAVVERFKADIKQHVATGIPVQHLTGYEFFYGRQFTVTPDTLIPRPETEELVQHVLEIVKTSHVDAPVIVDIGTGSGVIAITLALELPTAQIYATDISPAALAVARANAERLQANVTFYEGDYVAPVIEHALAPWLLVSNPPYIAEAEAPTLARTVKEFDPALALFADDEGLAAYQQITAQATVLEPSLAYLVYEIGYQQGEAVKALIKHNFPTSNVQVITDLNQNDRIVAAKLNS